MLTFWQDTVHPRGDIGLLLLLFIRMQHGAAGFINCWGYFVVGGCEADAIPPEGKSKNL